jgi:hypothetical protein
MKFRCGRRVPALLCGAALCLVSSVAWGSPESTAARGRTPPRAAAGAEAHPVAVGAVPGMTSIAGTAWKSDNTPIPNARLRLRNVRTGKLEAATVADQSGRFTFTGVEAGSYVVELVSDAGKVLSVGRTFVIAPGESVATLVRLGGKVPWFQGFFGNAATSLSTAAAGLGVTAIAPAAKQCASPPGCR